MIRLLSTLALMLLVACASPDDDSTVAVEEMNSAETADAPMAMNEPTGEPVYVDVRTQEEFDSAHVVGAIHIPYDEMEDRWEELAEYEGRPVVLYCRTGRRSGIAYDILAGLRFPGITNGGGLADLAAQGVPTEQ